MTYISACPWKFLKEKTSHSLLLVFRHDILVSRLKSSNLGMIESFCWILRYGLCDFSFKPRTCNWHGQYTGMLLYRKDLMYVLDKSIRISGSWQVNVRKKYFASWCALQAKFNQRLWKKKVFSTHLQVTTKNISGLYMVIYSANKYKVIVPRYVTPTFLSLFLVAKTSSNDKRWYVIYKGMAMLDGIGTDPSETEHLFF